MSDELTQESKDLQAERGAKYGPFLEDMVGQSRIAMTLLVHRLRVMGLDVAANTIESLIGEGHLDDMIPLFMSKAVKAMRDATGVYNADNRADSANYDWIGEKIRKRMSSKEDFDE